MSNYPVRYGEGASSESPEFSEIVGDLVDGKTKLLAMLCTREEVESNNIADLSERLDELVETRESAMAAMQRVVLFTDGYDDDSRELWEIPEVRLFVKRLFEACPQLFFLAYPDSGTLKLVMSCCCRFIRLLDDGRSEFDSQDFKKFMDTGFCGLNEVTQRLAISTEINRAISQDLLSTFTGVAES